MILNYEIILYRSEEDGLFVAEVPELPGCMAHGDSQQAVARPQRTQKLGAFILG